MAEIKIAPSILDADLTRLGEGIRMVEEAGADVLHVDVMDGHFVPNILAGPRITAAIKDFAKIPVDVHLMITDPLKYVPRFVETGVDIIMFHVEAVENPRPILDKIKDAGCRCGLALKPHTPAESVEPYAEELDCLMAMTVEPGFSGQGFMEVGCEKIPRLREMCGSDIDVYVDGGIGPETAGTAVRYGANVLAAASAIFNAGVPPGEAVRRLRAAGKKASLTDAN